MIDLIGLLANSDRLEGVARHNGCALPGSGRRIFLIALGLLALSLGAIAGTTFPSFHIKSKLNLNTISRLEFIFHHEENIPVTIAAGDFNGDGRPDLVVGSLWNNEYSNELRLYPGSGDGTFGAPLVTKLNVRPQQAQIADFNGDGLSDVALVTNPQTSGGDGLLWVFLGTKDGPLKSTYSLPLGQTPSAVFVADFNHDGKLDVAASAWSSIFWIFSGRGDGTFADPVVGCHCDVSVVADLNGDGRPDLIVREGINSAVRVNRGDGTFAHPTPLSGEGSADAMEFRERVQTGDLNGDGVPDLIFANRREQGLSLYLGNGDGTFRAAGTLAASGELVSALRIGDLNGDGFADILATVWRRNSGDLLIFPGTGGGRFGAPISIRTGYAPSDVGIADFNLDHKLDLAVSSMGGLSVSVFLQNR